MYDSFLVSVSSDWIYVRERQEIEGEMTHVDGGYNPFTPSFETSFTPMYLHYPRKAWKIRRGGEPRRCDRIGECGQRNRSGEGVLIIRKRRDRLSIFQSMMETFGFFMSHLFESRIHPHRLRAQVSNVCFTLKFGLDFV
jgi:hypothetical protein